MMDDLADIEFEPGPDDVPLMDAELLWNDGGALPSPMVIDIDRVVRGRSRRTRAELESFDNCVGSCFDFWPNIDPEQQMSRMLAWAWQAVVRDGVRADEMHAALRVIPEYRALMGPDMFERSEEG